MTTIIGLIASALTTFSFLPQAIQVVRTRDTRSLSLPMYLLFVLGITLWLIYGLFKHDFPIILGNAITGIFAGIILVFKIKEVRKK